MAFISLRSLGSFKVSPWYQSFLSLILRNGRQSHTMETHMKQSALYISPYDEKNASVVNVDLDLSDINDDATLAGIASNIELREMNVNAFKLV